MSLSDKLRQETEAEVRATKAKLAAIDTATDVIRAQVGPCREWEPSAHDMCGRPAEYVLWGKLIPTEALGPRCYGCAAKHIGHHGLGSGTTHALIHIGDLARAVAHALRQEDGR